MDPPYPSPHLNTKPNPLRVIIQQKERVFQSSVFVKFNEIPLRPGPYSPNRKNFVQPYPYFDSPRLDLTVFGLRPKKSKTIRQKNLKKIKFYHVGLVNILLNLHKAEKLTIS